MIAAVTTENNNTNFAEEDAREADANEPDDLDIEIALLATTAGQDAGEPTETVNLASLTPAEKRALLALLRRSLGLPQDSGEPAA